MGDAGGVGGGGRTVNGKFPSVAESEAGPSDAPVADQSKKGGLFARMRLRGRKGVVRASLAATRSGAGDASASEAPPVDPGKV